VGGQSGVKKALSSSKAPGIYVLLAALSGRLPRYAAIDVQSAVSLAYWQELPGAASTVRLCSLLCLLTDRRHGQGRHAEAGLLAYLRN